MQRFHHQASELSLRVAASAIRAGLPTLSMSQDTWRLFSSHCSPGGKLTAEQLTNLLSDAGLQQGELQALFAQHASNEAAGVSSLNYPAFLQLLQVISATNPNVWHLISKEAMEAASAGSKMESVTARVSVLEDLFNTAFTSQVESSKDSKQGAAVNHVAALTSIVNSIHSLTAGLKQVQSQQVEHAAMIQTLKQVQSQQLEHTAMLQALVDRVEKLEHHGGGSVKSSLAMVASTVSACGQLQVSVKAVHPSDNTPELPTTTAVAMSTADAQNSLNSVCAGLREVQKTATEAATIVQLHEGAMHVIHERLANLEGLNSQVWELQERIRHNKEELEQHNRVYHHGIASCPATCTAMALQAVPPGDLNSSGKQPQLPSNPRVLQSHGSLGRASLGNRSSLTQALATDSLPLSSHFDPAPSASEIQRLARTKRSSQPGEQLHLDSPCIRSINQFNISKRISLTSPGVAPFSNATMPSPHSMGKPPVSDRFKAIQDSELSTSGTSVKSEPAVPGELVLHATEFLNRKRLSSSGTADKAVQQGMPQGVPIPANGVLSSMPSPASGSTNAPGSTSAGGGTDCTAEPPEGPTIGLAAVAQQLRAGPPRPPRLSVFSNGQGRTSSPNMSLPYSPNAMCP